MRATNPDARGPIFQRGVLERIERGFIGEVCVVEHHRERGVRRSQPQRITGRTCSRKAQRAGCRCEPPHFRMLGIDPAERMRHGRPSLTDARDQARFPVLWRSLRQVEHAAQQLGQDLRARAHLRAQAEHFSAALELVCDHAREVRATVAWGAEHCDQGRFRGLHRARDQGVENVVAPDQRRELRVLLIREHEAIGALGKRA